MARLATLAWALVLLPAIAHALPADTWVVTIGNNRGHADDVELLYAQRDAEAVARVLRRLGGVSSTRVVQLFDESAETVREALDRVAEEIEAQAAGRPSAVVIYYSGHADASALHLGADRLPFDELRARTRSMPALARVLIVDACRSGGLSRVKGARRAPSFPVRPLETTVEGVAIITSSTANESSQESDRLRGSFFSHHLVNGLRGAADKDGDGLVTLAEAYDHTYAETVRSSGQTPQVQHPTYAWDVKGRDDLVLTRPGRVAEASAWLILAEPVVYLVHDALAGGLVAEVRPARARARLSLPPGAYHVQQRRPREYLAYDLSLRAGQTLVLDRVPARATRYDRLVRKGGGDRAGVHGLTVLGGGRTELVDGEGPTPQLTVGYGVDLRWLSAGLRLRASRVSAEAAEGRAPRWHDELGLGVTLQHAIDFDHLSLAFGVLVEGVVHRQLFTGDRAPPERRAIGLGLGLLFSVERILYGGLSARLESGPYTAVLPGSDVEGGIEVETVLRTPLVNRAALGLVWRF